MFRGSISKWPSDGQREYKVEVNPNKNVGYLPAKFISWFGDDEIKHDVIYTIDRKDNCFALKLKIKTSLVMIIGGLREFSSFYRLKESYVMRLRYTYEGVFYVRVLDSIGYELDYGRDPSRNFKKILPPQIYAKLPVHKAQHKMSKIKVEDGCNSTTPSTPPRVEIIQNSGSGSRSGASNTAYNRRSKPTYINGVYTIALTRYWTPKSQLTFTADFTKGIIRFGTSGE